MLSLCAKVRHSKGKLRKVLHIFIHEYFYCVEYFGRSRVLALSRYTQCYATVQLPVG